MSGKIKLRMSPAVAEYVRPGVGSDVKLHGVGTAALLSDVDQVTLLFCLMRDSDSAVKVAASTAFTSLAEEVLLSCATSPGLHPAILDTLARVHHTRPSVVAALLENPELSPAASAFLGGAGGAEPPQRQGDDDGRSSCVDAGTVDVPPEGDEPPDDMPREEAVTEGDEEYLSKFQMLQRMGIGEKIKMALTGDKEWRAILVNDSNKLVSGSVVKNPRITEGEIQQFLKVGVQNDEIIRLICVNKEWVKNYQIRKALVDCPKTPLPNALRFLATLGEKDIAAYAKSKNVSTVISTQAKRILLAKKK